LTTSKRLSEKTVEINFCAQWRFGRDQAFWFGLTQAEERQAGYDVITRNSGRLFILQFKASSRVLRNGERQFHAPHHQLLALQDRVKGSRDIFYVLPRFGTTAELRAKGWRVADNCSFLNVADIPAVGPPTRSDGALRKKGHHLLNFNQTTGLVTIHSDPVTVETTDAMDFASSLADAVDVPTDGPRLRFESYRDFERFARAIGRKAVGYFMPGA
jgi:hypothetical protein